MTANAEIILEEHPDSLIVPEAAHHLRRAAQAPRSTWSIARARRAPQGAGQDRASATAPGRRCSTGSRRATRSCCRRRAASGRRHDTGTRRCAKPSIRRSTTCARNKLRSFLTMFGIMWGIVSIVILSATRRGLPRGNDARAARVRPEHRASSGAGRTSLQAGGERAGRRVFLTVDDARAVVDAVVARARGEPRDPARGLRVKSAYNASANMVHGIEPPYQDIRTIDIERGRQLNWDDEQQVLRVAMVGADVVKQLFGDARPAGRADQPQRPRVHDRGHHPLQGAGQQLQRPRQQQDLRAVRRPWRETFRDPTRRPAPSRRSSSRHTSGWSTTCLASCANGAAASRTSTGRSRRTSAPCSPAARDSIRTTARRSPCGTPRSRR